MTKFLQNLLDVEAPASEVRKAIDEAMRFHRVHQVSTLLAILEATGMRKIARDLTVANLGLATSIAQNYFQTTPADPDDIVGRAKGALARAADYYTSHEQKGPFLPYAARIIRNELNRFFREEMTYKDKNKLWLDADADDENESGAMTIGQVSDPLTKDAPTAINARDAMLLINRLINELGDARLIKAIKLSQAGETFQKIGDELGVSDVQAMKITQRGQRLLKQKLAGLGIKSFDDILQNESLRGAVGRKDQEEYRIAIDTLRMADPMARVMGGPTKHEAVEVLRRGGWTEDRLKAHLEALDYTAEQINELLKAVN